MRDMGSYDSRLGSFKLHLTGCGMERRGCLTLSPARRCPGLHLCLVCHPALHCSPVVLWLFCSGQIYKFIIVDIISMHVCHPGLVERMAAMVAAQFKTMKNTQELGCRKYADWV